MLGPIKAIWLLAWSLVRTLVRRALGLARRGVAAFEANYADDGLSRVSAAERALMGAFGRCLGCGLCDRGESQRIVASQGVYRGIMALVVSESRSMPDFRASVASLEWVDESSLESKEAACPASVPLTALVRFVRAKAERARVSVPASQGKTRVTPAELQSPV